MKNFFYIILFLPFISIAQNDVTPKIACDLITDYERAKEFTYRNTRNANSIEELKAILDNEGGFVEGYWNGDAETELKIKELTKATIRCIPLGNHANGKCILTGEEGALKVVFARAY